MTPEPLCAVCSHPLPPLAIHHADPYCRMECARIANNCPLPSYKSGLHYGKNWRKEANAS